MSGTIQGRVGAPGPTTNTDALAAPLNADNSGPPIHRLPSELLVEVVRYYSQGDTRLRDTIRLTLVCKRWSMIVQGAPILWTVINAAEGPSVVRKALQNAKDALLDLTFNWYTAQMEREAFFESVGRRIGYWRTLAVLIEFPEWNFVSEHLEKSTPPNLEALHLSAGHGQGGRDMILFRGNPAPPQLKEISLVNVPIKLSPVQLRGLKSLTIGSMSTMPATDFLNIILESPAIESIRLRYLDYAPGVAPPEQPSSHPGAFCNSPIRLASLIHLSLVDIYPPFLHLLLSLLTAPHLQTLDIECDVQEESITHLLDGLGHQLATLGSLTADAQTLTFELSSYAFYRIVIGGLDIRLLMSDLPTNASEEVWTWVCTHLGRSLKYLSAHLRIFDWEPQVPARLEWFTHHSTVTKLTLQNDPYYGMAVMDPIVPFLSRPITSNSAPWLFPQVEILETNLVQRHGNDALVEMIKNRHSAEDGKDGIAAPKPFREIWLSFGGKLSIGAPDPVNVGFLQEVQRVAGRVDVYWEKKKLE
ncbi:hypothetical protein FRC01_006795 [Tulasnella sp. 417]|nr:hypothetical protein FRC01_006795 [Tulasnella sp. 417]